MLVVSSYLSLSLLSAQSDLSFYRFFFLQVPTDTVRTAVIVVV